MRFNTVLDTKMNQFENAKKWLFDVSYNPSYISLKVRKNGFYNPSYISLKVRKNGFSTHWD
jgi:hypothetical protein